MTITKEREAEIRERSRAYYMVPCEDTDHLLALRDAERAAHAETARERDGLRAELARRDAAPVSREAAYALVEEDMREIGARRVVLWPGDACEVTITTRNDSCLHESLLAAVDALKAGRT